MATIEIINGNITVDGVTMSSREQVQALSQEILSEIKTEIYDNLPISVKQDMITDNEIGAKYILQISEYLGKFDQLITDMSEKYDEYGLPLLMQVLASLETNEKLTGRRYETVQQLGLQYFNNYSGLIKLVTGFKGSGDEPAMTSAAITAQNQFAKGVRA